MNRWDRKTWWRAGAAVVLTAAMVAAAQATGEREILFPEILALAAGAWVAPRQPWQVSKGQMLLLMPVCAAMGVLVVRYLPVGLTGQILLGFSLVALLLLLTKTTLVPMLSACVLPVLLQTDSWVYPAAVAVLTGLIVLIQWGMEKAGLRDPERLDPAPFSFGGELLRWGKRLLAVAALAVPAVALGCPYLIAPPLLVAFTELSSPTCGMRSRPWTAYFMLAGAAFLGVGCRLLSIWGQVPLAVSATLAAAGVLLGFALVKRVFPPVGAIALLPMLLKEEALLWYPVQVLGGGALLLGAALLFFKSRQNAGQEPLDEEGVCE